MRHGVTPYRLRLLLLLPLLSLFAQQGAWLHLLGHATYAAAGHAPVAQQHRDAGDGDQCPTCQSFGQVAFSASGKLPELSFFAPAYLRSAEPRFSIIAVAPPSPRSRGPPSI